MSPESSGYQIQVLVTAQCELATRTTMLPIVCQHCKLGYPTVVGFCSARLGRPQKRKEEEYESLSTEVFHSTCSSRLPVIWLARTVQVFQ